MIRLVDGQDNKINVYVASSIDTTDFTVQISVGGTTKTIPAIKDNGNYVVTFSTAEVSSMPSTPMTCEVTVLKADSSTYMTSQTKAQKYPATESTKVIGYQTIPIIFAANWVGTVEEEASE